MLKLDEQGRCWNGDMEVFQLNEYQLDQLCDDLYPTDHVIKNQYMTAKRARSHSGSRFGFATLTDMPATTQDVHQALPDEQLIAIGGPRLLAIYRANCVLSVAAADLGIREDALRRWFHRFKQADASQSFKAILYDACGTPQDRVTPVS